MSHRLQTHVFDTGRKARPARKKSTTPLCAFLLAPALLFVATASEAAPSESLGGQTTQGEQTIRWSTPHRPTHQLATWHNLYKTEMVGVHHAWARLLERLNSHRPRLFSSRCDDLGRHLRMVDANELLPAPEILLDHYLKRMLFHLDHATQHCSADQLFNVVYRLEEARSALAEIRFLLETRGLRP